MQYEELLHHLQHAGKDPARLIFEDELTGIANRRFLLNYLEHKVPWDEPDKCRLSVIMIDLDGFKQINDSYGHQVGDQALIWFASRLKEVAGDDGLPIRYAGDEFIVLMPDSGKREARRLAENLLQRVREQPFRLRGLNESPTIRMSLGIATVPDDAREGSDLIRQADTALYSAKETGGDCLALADDIDPAKVFAKTALHQITDAEIVGRRTQLERVADALDHFSSGENRFQLVTGAPGMGKSAFLETIRRKLAGGSLGHVVKVHAKQEELFRPYSLAAEILLGLLNQREDKGLAVLDAMGPEDMRYAGTVLPQLAIAAGADPEQDERERREGIFNTFLRLIARALEDRPFILLIDDLHFADEATLNLLRVMMKQQGTPLFVCATSADMLQQSPGEEMAPLERFHSAHAPDLGIEDVKLTPLGTDDIADHLRRLFPDVVVPEGFENELAQIVQGNPLFLGEVLRKLVMDQKIVLSGREWVVRPTASDELPRSLEEIVNEKIAALDEEGQKLLAQASVFGEHVNLSALVGSTETMESRVLEFVDQAVDLGLLNAEFQLNDETMKFIGKRVLEIVYGSLHAPRREELHEIAGGYQEKLYEQHLGSSASILAYHFKRSASQGKARAYEQLQRDQNNYVFNSAEIAFYSGDAMGESFVPDPPLDPESAARLPGVLRCLQIAVNNIKLYPPESGSIGEAIGNLLESLEQILEVDLLLNLHRGEDGLRANGEAIEGPDIERLTAGIDRMLGRLELKGVTFHRGVTEEELRALLEPFAHTRPEELDSRFWHRYSRDHELAHLNLKQFHYSEVEPKTWADQQDAEDVLESLTDPAESRPEAPASQAELDAEDWGQIRDVIRCVQGAALRVRLYPADSQAVAEAVEQLADALRAFLDRRDALTLAAAGEALLANGARVVGQEFESLAAGFLEFLQTIGLSGLSFLAPITADEIAGFITALLDLPPEDVDRTFWKRVAREKGISNIRFDEDRYEVGVLPTLVGLAPAGGGEAPEEASGVDVAVDLPSAEKQEPDAEEEGADEPFEQLVEALPGRVGALLLEDDVPALQALIARVFAGFAYRDVMTRERAISACRTALQNLSSGFRCGFVRALAKPLSSAFADEGNPDVIREMAALLHRMAAIAIHSAEHTMASRILSQLRDYHRQLEARNDSRAAVLAPILFRKLEPSIRELLLEDLYAADSERQQAAARVITALGRAALPLLVDVVKDASDRRARQMAGNLLAENGAEAAELLKRELAAATGVEQRVRILDVLDTLTRDLSSELARALGDSDEQVRQAGLRLAGRLNDSQTFAVLLDHARNQETQLAVTAIRWLGRLKARAVAEELVSILSWAGDAARVTACCQTLGEMADPVAVDALERVLGAKQLLTRRRRWPSPTRAAAAVALSQIPNPSAAEALAGYLDDPDPAVQRVAESGSRS